MRVVEAAAARFGLRAVGQEGLDLRLLPKHGRMMPEDGLDQIQGHDAMFLGAVGLPRPCRTTSPSGAC